MDRRAFLRASLATCLLPATARLYAAPQGGGRFLLVFLRGGYDAANVVVPSGSAFYYDARPNIAVARDELLPLDADWGLHPSLRDTMHAMYRKSEIAFVPFAGTEDLSRSHFETQDSIELGLPAGQRRDYGSGFLNRLVTRLQGKRAIAFTDQLPLVMRGEAQVANATLRVVGRAGVNARETALISGMYRDTPLASSVTGGFAARDEVAHELEGEMAAANRNAVNPRNFERQARRVGRLMRASYNIGFVDVGGWDTHVGEGGAAGYLPQRLEELGRGLAAMADELGPAWRETVVVVISEFGRTFRENGNRGTDHGHGSVYWIVGGAVRGGRIAGEQVRVERSSLFQDRDYPVLNDYRAVLGGLFSRLYSLSAMEMEQIFPGVATRDLQLI